MTKLTGVTSLTEGTTNESFVNEMKVFFEKNDLSQTANKTEIKLKTLMECSVMPINQRNFLDDDKKANGIMASLIAGIDIPECIAAINFNELATAFILYILDGQQRIGSFSKIIHNHIRLDVEGFISAQGVKCDEIKNELMPYDGMNFEEIKEVYPEIAARIENATVMMKFYFNPSDEKRRFLFALYNKNQESVRDEELRKSAFVGTPLYDAIKNVADKCTYDNKDTKYHLAAFVKNNLREKRTDYIAQLALIIGTDLKDFKSSEKITKCIEKMYNSGDNSLDYAKVFTSDFDKILNIISNYKLDYILSHAHIATVSQSGKANMPVTDAKKKLLFKVLVQFVKDNEKMIKENKDVDIAEILVNAINSSAYQTSYFASVNTNGTGKVESIVRNSYLWGEIVKRNIKAIRANKNCRINYNKIFENYLKEAK